MLAKIQDAIESIKKGKMIILVDDDNDENEGVLAMAAEHASKESINFMMKYARGTISTPITEDRLKELELPLLTKMISHKKAADYTMSVDYVEVVNGTSAEDKALTIRKLAAGGRTGRDFNIPGHVFPVIALNGGVLRRAGYAEAIVDLAGMAGINPVGAVCEVLNEEGSMAKLPQLKQFAQEHGLYLVSIENLIAYRKERECYITKEAEAKLPTAYGEFKIVGFVNKLNGKHHVALVKGEIGADDEVLVRVHSECLTGDAFHSMKCDCGEQLAAALTAIEKEGKGVLLYLRQEGRGIGLINKIKAYYLQDQGLDTEEANLALGFPPDLRDYGIGAQILSELNVRKVRLMTNNPLKVVGLKGHGIEVVERVPLVIESNTYNEKYLNTKKEKMGHLI